MTAELDELVDELIEAEGITSGRGLVRRILLTGLGLGADATDRLDLKITAAALDEMRAAFRLFAPYRDVPKVTVFGSARTRPDDPLYRQARDVAAALAAKGWMVVTGAGPGIMQAATEGAGPELSIGVSIRLPFEEKPSEGINEPNRVTMKYFFTRKLMLMKESRGFVCVPGGFGTLDETFELLTLQQTGKAEPSPIVLLDERGGGFWRGLERFVDEQLVPSGVISTDDFDRVLVTDSVEAATAEIVDFWSNYDSLRWVGDTLVLRVRRAPTPAQLADLDARFGSYAPGGIRTTAPLPPEVSDRDRLDLPRVALRLDQHHVGELHHLIRALNAV